MSASFPANLAGYETAVIEALRQELRADLASIPLPDSMDLREAFFRRVPPLDFAWQWMHDQASRARRTSARHAGPDSTLPLF